MSAPPSTKDTLRQTAYRKRMTLPAAAQKKAAHDLMEKFMLEVPLKPGLVVAGYWPVHAEINVMPLLVKLCKAGYACALPQIVGKTAPLAFRAWNEKTPMKQNAYEMKEPDPASSPVVVPDILIVPLLAFDATRHRLGYGAGFYDRTFAQLKKGKPFTAIGVAYDTQKINAIPVEPHDHALDMVVTDRHIYKAG